MAVSHIRTVAAPEPAFTCPACHMTSHHPGDIARGYCGACHDFTGGVPAFATALDAIAAAGYRGPAPGGPVPSRVNVLASMAGETGRAALTMARAVAAGLLEEGSDAMHWVPGDPEW